MFWPARCFARLHGDLLLIQRKGKQQAADALRIGCLEAVCNGQTYPACRRPWCCMEQRWSLEHQAQCESRRCYGLKLSQNVLDAVRDVSVRLRAALCLRSSLTHQRKQNAGPPLSADGDSMVLDSSARRPINLFGFLSQHFF